MAAPKGNKFAQGLTTSGRPPIYKEDENGAKEMFAKIIEYFEYIQGEFEGNDIIRAPEPATITGLTLYLGFASKNTLYEYAKKEVFKDSIKRALTFVEKNYEEMLLSKASTGAIFALKNMGWVDTQKIDQTVTQKKTVFEIGGNKFEID